MEHMTMAQACGEEPFRDGWVAGVDFDPSDPDEMEVMHDVWERERYDRIAELERENDRLRGHVFWRADTLGAWRIVQSH